MRRNRFGGVAALVLAGVLLARGEVVAGAVAAAVGLSLLGWISLWPPSFAGYGGAKRVSRVRTTFLEMELDHGSGAMRGRILAGSCAGAALDTLDVPTLVGLLGGIDGDSRDLLAAYLDRRDADWRQHAQGDAAAGRGPRAARSGKMTEQEAYQILGIAPGASAEEVSRAHRSLMKKLHPDQGGSTYLAARVNEAKDVLVRRHR